MKRPWLQIPVQDKIELMKHYRGLGYSYRDAMYDFEDSLKKYEEGGKIIKEEPIKAEETSTWDNIKTALNPYNWGVEDYSDKGDFGNAYSSARQSGEKEFMFGNKRYNTNYSGTPQEQLKETGITNERLQGSNEIRKRIANNVIPQGYGHIGSAVKSIIYNKPEIPIYDEDVKYLIPTDLQDSTFYKNKYNPFVSSEKIPAHKDALNLTMGIPQEYNSFAVSSYTPTISKNSGNTYYKLNDDEAKNNILLRAFKEKDFNTLTSKQLIAEIDNPNYTEAEGALGTYTISKGKDEKGDYISYYDINDYDPIGRYNPGKDGSNILNPFGKPFEIYDRIYYKDYGNGEKKRMYYSDKELSELDANKKNFDTLALQQELINRGINLPKSMEYGVILDYYDVEDNKDVLEKKTLKNKYASGEQGVSVKLTKSEYSKINKKRAERIDQNFLQNKNTSFFKQEYGNRKAHIKDMENKYKEAGNTMPTAEYASIHRIWDRIEKDINLGATEYLKQKRKENPDLYKLSYTEEYDGIYGDETKQALKDWQSKNKVVEER